jgi:hypothetical protein
MQMFREASLMAILTILLTFTPLVMAVAYVIRPTERRLALMRPLSLAGLFSGLTSFALGFINTLRYVGVRRETPIDYSVAAIGAAESMVALFVGFGCLTVAWLLVAAGMARQRE